MGTLLHRHGIFPGGVSVPAPFFEGDLSTQPFASQSIWPAAIHHAGSNKTFMVWETDTRPNSVKVAEYDHATSAITQIVTVDSHTLEDNNHGIPSLEILSDGRIVCFYGSHNDDLQWSISDQSGGNPDISNWTRQTALTAANYAYPKPVNVPGVGGAGTLYLFARDFNGSGYPFVVQSAAYASGGAVSFGAKSTIYDRSSSRVYAAEFHLDGSGNIEIACTNGINTDTKRFHVHFIRYMTATGALENFDGSVSTASGSLPINVATADASYRLKDSGVNSTGFVSFCRDSNGYAHLLYGDGTSPDVDVKHTFHNGTSWSAETTLFQARDGGITIGTAGGGSITNFCLVPGASGTVQAWYGNGNIDGHTNNATDTIKRRTWNGSTWGGSQTMLPRGSRGFGGPSAVRNATASLRVLCQEAGTSVADIDAQLLRRYMHGDSGFLDWGTPVNDPYLYQNALLLNFNGADGATTTSDASSWSHLHPVTFAGNAQLDTAQKKFGTASLLLDGTGDYISIPPSRENQITSGHEFGFDGFDTLELWIRPNELGRLQGIMTTKENIASVNYGFFLYQWTSNQIFCSFYGGPGKTGVGLIGTTALSTGTWYHIAIRRLGTLPDLELRINGVVDATATITEDTGPPTEGSTLYIGHDPVISGRNFNGWVDSVRWTKRTLRDVSAAPTTEFPED